MARARLVSDARTTTSTGRGLRGRVPHSLVLVGGEALGRLLAFASAIYVARTVTPDAWGVVALAAGVTIYLAKLADFGIDIVGVDAVAKRPAEVGTLVSALLAVRLRIAVLFAAMGIGWAALALEGLERDTVALYVLTILPVAASTRWAHLGLERAWPVAVWRLTADAVAFAGVVLFISTPGDVWRFPLAVLAGELLNVTMLAALLVSGGHALTWRGPYWTVAQPVLRRAAPMTAQLLLGLAIYNADLIFLRVFRSSEAVGYYAAAFAVVSFIANLTIAYRTSTLPALSRAAGDITAAQTVFDTIQLHGLAVALPIAVGGSLMATDVMVGVYGPEYRAAGPLLATLLFSVPFSTVRLIWFTTFVALERQTDLVRAMVAAAVFNTVLNVLLISQFGAIGAAWSTVATDVFLAGLMHVYGAASGIRTPAVVRLAWPAAACVVMAGVLTALSTSPWLLRVLAGALVYGAVLAAAGVIRFSQGRPSVAL